MFTVGQFFQHHGGEIYLLANVGQCPMLIGISTGNRWSDGHRSEHFAEAFTVRTQEEWNLVTSNQSHKFTPIDMVIKGCVIQPDWQV